MMDYSKSFRLVGALFMLLLLLNGQLALGWEIPKFSLPDIFPDSMDSQKALSGILGCGLGGVTGIIAAKQMARLEGKKKRLSKTQENDLANRYMLGFGMAGCVVGKGAADAIYNKLSERAKQKREETIQAAINEETAIHRSGQPASGKPYSWEMDGASGQITVADVNEESSGRICVIVDENIEIEGETAKPLTKRCNTPPSPEWVAVGA